MRLKLLEERFNIVLNMGTEHLRMRQLFVPSKTLRFSAGSPYCALFLAYWQLEYNIIATKPVTQVCFPPFLCRESPKGD